MFFVSHRYHALFPFHMQKRATLFTLPQKEKSIMTVTAKHWRNQQKYLKQQFSRLKNKAINLVKYVTRNNNYLV